jgi:hypothetical protein
VKEVVETNGSISAKSHVVNRFFVAFISDHAVCEVAEQSGGDLKKELLFDGV